jgi:NAD(P) transhydrogenase
MPGADRYDLVVIGSGPAGEKGAAQAAYFGKRVALVEKEAFLGGAAANTGTLPSKTLRETALYLTGFRQRQLLGLDLGLKKKVSVRDFLQRERYVKDQERQRIRENLHRHHVTLYKGNASFVDAHTVAVTPERCPPLHLTGDVVLIATGSYPYRPSVFPFHDPRVYDSDTVLTLPEIPASLLVVGGGVIGCEYACLFAALGTKITIIEGRDALMGFLDGEMSRGLKTALEREGHQVLLGDAVLGIERIPGGPLHVTLKSGKRLEVDKVLYSAGRAGNTAGLGLERAGVKLDPKGRILVNEHFQTSAPRIYAAGDVVGNPALASVSMEQGRVAMCHAFGFPYKTKVSPLLPIGVYTIPEISMVGATEDELRARGADYEVGRAVYHDNARGQIIGEPDGAMKLLFTRDTRQLLGVHIIGDRATELVHIGQMVMEHNGSIDVFIDGVFNFPTLSEIYKYAAYDGLGRLAKGSGRSPTVGTPPA